MHRTFQEYLAALDAMNTDDVGTVVQNGHLDQWHEVVVMAVGHASKKLREELLSRLLERGDCTCSCSRPWRPLPSWTPTCAARSRRRPRVSCRLPRCPGEGDRGRG